MITRTPAPRKWSADRNSANQLRLTGSGRNERSSRAHSVRPSRGLRRAGSGSAGRPAASLEAGRGRRVLEHEAGRGRRPGGRRPGPGGRAGDQADGGTGIGRLAMGVYLNRGASLSGRPARERLAVRFPRRRPAGVWRPAGSRIRSPARRPRRGRRAVVRSSRWRGLLRHGLLRRGLLRHAGPDGRKAAEAPERLRPQECLPYPLPPSPCVQSLPGLRPEPAEMGGINPEGPYAAPRRWYRPAPRRDRHFRTPEPRPHVTATRRRVIFRPRPGDARVAWLGNTNVGSRLGKRVLGDDVRRVFWVSAG